MQAPPHLVFAAMRNGEFPQVITARHNLLMSRLQLRISPRGQLSERIGRLREQINGLARIRNATDRETNIFHAEAEALEALREKRIINLAR